MPIVPTIEQVQEYLGDTHSWADADIETALAAEVLAQAASIRIPADPVDDQDPPVPIPQPYPADIAEALFRRVAHNLALRALPLGLQTTLTEVGASVARVGGGDAEVRRLERPYRKLTVG